MDLHILPGVKARDVAEAHRRDLLIQDDHRCNCMTYWIDEKRGNVFCLIEAPAREAVSEMHRKAHGLIPHKIIEVNSTLVESFLGRISDPDSAITSADGLTIFSDESLRTIMVIQLQDPVLLQNQIGKEKANGFLRSQHYIIQKELGSFDGSEVKHAGSDYIASFISASNAVRCAISIRDILMGMSPENAFLRIGIHAGDPVTQNDSLFGDTIQFAKVLGSIAKDFQIAISSTVRDLASKDHIRIEDQMMKLSLQDENFLQQLFKTLEEKWQDPDFDMEDYGKIMATSNSQLYRKTLALTGQSPNNLLKDYRLERAREMMKRSTSNISQITFDAGFSSPSYFTKCFKKRYGMLPMEYMEGA